MSNKQVLAYGVLQSTNDLRSVFVGRIHFKKLYRNISPRHDQAQEQEFGCFYTMPIYKNHLKKQKYGTESV